MVVSCVEELYQRGKHEYKSVWISRRYVLGLKRSIYFSPPSASVSSRVIELQHLFNTAPQYGFDTSLNSERETDIYSLLLLFLDQFPEAILGTVEFVQGFKKIIWEWCILTTTGRWRLHESEGTGVHISDEKDEELCRDSLLSAVVASVHNSHKESVQIIVVQHLLRLLPSSSLSLVVYLLAFLKQLVAGLSDEITVSPEREEVCRMFAKWIFGSSSKEEDASTVIIVWLVTRWEKIVDGLFSMDIRDKQPPKIVTPPKHHDDEELCMSCISLC